MVTVVCLNVVLLHRFIAIQAGLLQFENAHEDIKTRLFIVRLSVWSFRSLSLSNGGVRKAGYKDQDHCHRRLYPDLTPRKRVTDTLQWLIQNR